MFAHEDGTNAIDDTFTTTIQQLESRSFFAATAKRGDRSRVVHGRKSKEEEKRKIDDDDSLNLFRYFWAL